MSEPTRYRVADNQAQLTLGGGVLVVDPAGPIVAYGAYAKLQAEVERLRKWMDDISLDTEGRLDSGLNVGWTLLKIKQEYNAAKEGKQP